MLERLGAPAHTDSLSFMSYLPIDFLNAKPILNESVKDSPSVRYENIIVCPIPVHRFRPFFLSGGWMTTPQNSNPAAFSASHQYVIP